MNTLKKMSATALLLLGGGLVLAATEVQAVDFNISTQLTDLRSNGTNGNPGFNPCVGGTRQTDGSCGGTAMNFNGTANALLDKDNLGDGTNVGNFAKAGPGAITDNMFGKVSGADLGPDGIAGTADDTPITACGKFTSGSTWAGLNCGDLRFDPTSQGQTIPTGQNTLVTPSGGLNMNTQFIADFCPGPGPAVTDCSNGAATPAQKIEAHVGFAIDNQFNFQVIDGTTAITSGVDNVRQVTAVKTTNIGTQASPNFAGDQLFVANVHWSTSNANPSSNDPTQGPANLTVSWHQEISDPDQSGTGSGAFTQSLDGTFLYNGTSPQIAAQYPNGRTQTERSIGLTPIGESMIFDAVP